MRFAPGPARTWDAWRDEFPILQHKTFYNATEDGERVVREIAVLARSRIA